MFRNAIIFQLPDPLDPGVLQQAVESYPVHPPGPLERSTSGFIPPLGRTHPAGILQQGQHSLLSLGNHTRMLPPHVINQALAERLDALESQSGRRPGGKTRSRIKDEVIAELLPRAFIKSTRTDAWFDHGNGWLVVDSATARAAETVVYHLRQALGSFPATPVAARASGRMQLTAWLAGDGLPDDFELGDECELRDPVEDGAIVRCRRQDMAAEEIAEHLYAGKQVTRLALGWAGRLSFVLDEQLTIRKLRLDDLLLDQLHDQDGDADAEAAARLVLLAGELTPLINRLDSLFGLGLGLAVGDASHPTHLQGAA